LVLIYSLYNARRIIWKENVLKGMDFYNYGDTQLQNQILLWVLVAKNLVTHDTKKTQSQTFSRFVWISDFRITVMPYHQSPSHFNLWFLQCVASPTIRVNAAVIWIFLSLHSWFFFMKTVISSLSIWWCSCFYWLLVTSVGELINLVMTVFLSHISPFPEMSENKLLHTF
jgi:hypothetical protein